MIIKNRPLFLFVLLFMALSGCGTPSPSNPAPVFPTTSTKKQSERISVLVDLDAPVYIKREGWKDYQTLGFGGMIFPTDLLRTEGKVLLVCPDFQTVLPFTGSGRNPCPLSSDETFLTFDQMFFFSGSRKGSPSVDTPFILYPRSTSILETHPVFQWNETGASSYTVELWNDANLVWEQSHVIGNSISYPLLAPNLEPGVDYLLIVTDTDTGKNSRMDPDKGLGFQIVSQTQMAEIENHKKAILGLADINPDARKLVLALYYEQWDVNHRGLWGEASRLLEEVNKIQLDTPAVHLRAGVILEQMKLWDKAKVEYEIALAQGTKINDLESQADALAALWRMFGDPLQFDQAVSLYEKIGDQYMVDLMNEKNKP